jgi:hypothetical protein
MTGVIPSSVTEGIKFLEACLSLPSRLNLVGLGMGEDRVGAER